MKSIIFLSLLSLAFSKQLINIKDCDEPGGGKVNAVYCDQCEAEPCQLKHGSTYTMRVNFTSNEQSAVAKTVIHGIIRDVEVPFKEEDACAAKSLACPEMKGTQMYNDTIYCSPAYPPVKLVGKWMLKDADGKNIFCFALPLMIVGA